MTDRQKYEGRVIAFREDNGYDDSDFYALVQKDNGEFGWIATGTTRFQGGWIATPNATPEVKAAYSAWYDAKDAQTKVDIEAFNDNMAAVGKAARVVGGKKYKNRQGEIFWFGVDKFRSSKSATYFRVGIEDSQGKFFVPADQIEIATKIGWIEPNNAMELTSSPLAGGISPAAWNMSQFPRPEARILFDEMV